MYIGTLIVGIQYKLMAGGSRWDNGVWFLLGQSSSIHWLPDKQCPPPFYTTAIPNNGTEITGVLQDFNFSSCLVPADKAENRLQIMFPLTMERARVSIKIMGWNLVCNPPRGMGTFGIGHCMDDVGCLRVLCTPTDFVMPHGGTGCKYKCYCNPACVAIILDISGLSSSSQTWKICEILLWLSTVWAISYTTILFALLLCR